MRPPSIRPVLALVFATGTGSCRAEPAALAVGDVEFSERELLGLSPDRRAALAEIAALGLAVNRGEVVDRATPLRARAEQRSLVRALRTHRLLLAADVGDDVLEARYQFDPEYELEVRHLVILAERGFPVSAREQAQASAAAALARVRAGEAFEDVAAEVSEEPGAADRGGLLRPGREGTWVDEFWSAARALEPGQVSGVVESPFGYHVLRLEQRSVVPFPQARDRVARQVADLLPPAAYDALRDSVAASIDVAPSASEWAEIAGGGSPIGGTALGAALDTVALDTVALATWNGGALTGADLRTFLQSGPAADERAALGGGSGTIDAVRDAALESALASMARGLELAPDESAVAAELDDWRVVAEGWAATLGLTGTSDPIALAERALSALGATGQNATVAREALQRERGPLLRALYEIRSAGQQDRGPG